MNNLTDKLAKLNLPDLMKFTDGTPVTADNWEARRLEILEILKNEEYGHGPECPFTVTHEVLSRDERAFASKAVESLIKLNIESEEGNFSFEIKQYIPVSESKVPPIIFLNFSPDFGRKYFPTEEIIDRGYAVFMVHYGNVIPDRKDDWSGLGEAFDRTKYDWGKIAMWAWAASRIRDYIETLSDLLDLENTAVLGHSRLGKTALWAAANDPRFKYALVNDSACSGDAITRGKTGEHVKEIVNAVGYWFCPSYAKYIDNEDAMPFDQHWLVAAVAPRYVVSGTAETDDWADPYSQFLSGYAASEAYKALGKNGLITPDKMPEVGDILLDGDIGFYLRKGNHFLSREDWNRYMDFMDSKMKQLK